MNKIEITNNAQEHIASILKKDSASYFRITVLGGGCAGFQYKLDFDEMKDDDVLIESNGVKFVMDSESKNLLRGSKIEYLEKGLEKFQKELKVYSVKLKK